MLDEKSLMKYKAIKINKPTIYAILSIMSMASIIKIILIGTGMTIMTSWRIYNSFFILGLLVLAICMSINGYRLRIRVKKMINKSKGTFKLTFMMVFGNIGMNCTSIIVFIWMVAPNIFGEELKKKWLIFVGLYSWFVFNFIWRGLALFFGSLFLFVYGTRFADRQVKSQDLQPKASNISLEPSSKSDINV
jgi:hypothetical protein